MSQVEERRSHPCDRLLSRLPSRPSHLSGGGGNSSLLLARLIGPLEPPTLGALSTHGQKVIKQSRGSSFRTPSKILSRKELQPFRYAIFQQWLLSTAAPATATRKSGLTTMNPAPWGPTKRGPHFFTNAYTRSASDGTPGGAYGGAESIRSRGGKKGPNLQVGPGEGVALKLQFGAPL
eukprot:147506-Amphidinium_carterae.1